MIVAHQRVGQPRDFVAHVQQFVEAMRLLASGRFILAVVEVLPVDLLELDEIILVQRRVRMLCKTNAVYRERTERQAHSPY